MRISPRASLSPLFFRTYITSASLSVFWLALLFLTHGTTCLLRTSLPTCLPASAGYMENGSERITQGSFMHEERCLLLNCAHAEKVMNELAWPSYYHYNVITVALTVRIS